jgi:hypothetical protein
MLNSLLNTCTHAHTHTHTPYFFIFLQKCSLLCPHFIGCHILKKKSKLHFPSTSKHKLLSVRTSMTFHTAKSSVACSQVCSDSLSSPCDTITHLLGTPLMCMPSFSFFPHLFLFCFLLLYKKWKCGISSRFNLRHSSLIQSSFFM